MIFAYNSEVCSTSALVSQGATESFFDRLFLTEEDRANGDTPLHPSRPGTLLSAPYFHDASVEEMASLVHGGATAVLVRACDHPDDATTFLSAGSIYRHDGVFEHEGRWYEVLYMRPVIGATAAWFCHRRQTNILDVVGTERRATTGFIRRVTAIGSVVDVTHYSYSGNWDNSVHRTQSDFSSQVTDEAPNYPSGLDEADANYASAIQAGQNYYTDDEIDTHVRRYEMIGVISSVGRGSGPITFPYNSAGQSGTSVNSQWRTLLLRHHGNTWPARAFRTHQVREIEQRVRSRGGSLGADLVDALIDLDSSRVSGENAQVPELMKGGRYSVIAPTGGFTQTSETEHPRIYKGPYEARHIHPGALPAALSAIAQNANYDHWGKDHAVVSYICDNIIPDGDMFRKMYLGERIDIDSGPVNVLPMYPGFMSVALNAYGNLLQAHFDLLLRAEPHLFDLESHENVRISSETGSSLDPGNVVAFQPTVLDYGSFPDPNGMSQAEQDAVTEEQVSESFGYNYAKHAVTDDVQGIASMIMAAWSGTPHL